MPQYNLKILASSKKDGVRSAFDLVSIVLLQNLTKCISFVCLKHEDGYT